MATVSGTFTAVGQSATLDVTSLGEDITISLTGGATATVELQREKVPYSGAWMPIRTYYGNVETSFRQERKNERYRFDCTSYTTGTVTYSVSDGDKQVGQFVDDEGNEIITYSEAGVAIPGTLDVTGATTLTGAITLTGAVAVDDTTDSTSGTTGSLQTDGGLGVTLDVFTDATLNAAGATAAGDSAAMGYTAALGLVLTGQGTTNDVTLRNDADADVLRIPTGTTGVTLAGALTDGAASTLTTGATIGNLTLANGSITDSGGAISFGNETLTTTGIITGAGEQTTLNVGSLPGTVTAVEWGDGYNHVTVLTVTAAVFVPDVPANAEEVGALIYTFPAGVHVVNAVHLDVTAIAIGSNSNAGDIGCGSTLAAGDGTTLQAATDEDFLDGQTIADVSSPAIEKSLAADGTVFESGDSKLFHINLAGNWTNAPGAGASTVTGTVTIYWTFLGA